MQIHVHKDGQQFGPYTLDQLREYVQQGYFTDQDHACYDGQNWVSIAQVPGYAGGAAAPAAQPQQAAQAQAGQQQAQAAAHQQAQAAQVQATAAASAAKKKKIILWSSIGGVAAACLIAGLLVWALGSSDEEPEEDEVADKGSSGGSGGSSGGSGGASLAGASLAERVPADALAVASLDLGALLDKSGPQAMQMLKGMGPPILGKVLDDPSTVGLDLSELLRVHFLKNPADANGQPMMVFSGKLSDAAKFGETVELLLGFEPPVEKDGYVEYAHPIGTGTLAVAEDFFILLGSGDRDVTPSDVREEIERFVNADGSDSFPAAPSDQKYDFGVRVNLDSIATIPEARESTPEEILKILEGGILSAGLLFDDGEVVVELAGSSEGLAENFGGGGLPASLAKYLGADAPVHVSLSLNLAALAELAADSLAEQGLPGLDDPVEDLGGFTPREVLDVFQGGFALSVTEFPDVPAGGGDFEVEPDFSPPGPGDFGPVGSSGELGVTPDGETFALESPPEFPFPGGPPDGGFPGGPPGGFPGGPPGGPGGPAAAMPQFVLAASIDAAKYQAFMSKYPIASTFLVGASAFGMAIQPQGDVLVVASSDHKDVAASGGFSTPLSGSAASLFREHDLVLRVSADPLTEWAREQGPEGALAAGALSKFDGLAITADSGVGEGSLSLRLTLKDKSKNSLAALVEIIAPLAAMMGGGGGPDHDHDHGHGSGPDHGPDFDPDF